MHVYMLSLSLSLVLSLALRPWGNNGRLSVRKPGRPPVSGRVWGRGHGGGRDPPSRRARPLRARRRRRQLRARPSSLSLSRISASAVVCLSSPRPPACIHWQPLPTTPSLHEPQPPCMCGRFRRPWPAARGRAVEPRAARLSTVFDVNSFAFACACRANSAPAPTQTPGSLCMNYTLESSQPPTLLVPRNVCPVGSWRGLPITTPNHRVSCAAHSLHHCPFRLTLAPISC